MFQRQIIRYSYTLNQIFTVNHKFQSEDILKFSQLSTDKNPIHLDNQIAEKSIFKQRVVHGILSASLFSALIGNNMPGAIYLGQTLEFKAPIFINEEIQAQIVIEKIIEKNNKQYLKLLTTIIKVNDKKIAIQGEANILI